MCFWYTQKYKTRLVVIYFILFILIIYLINFFYHLFSCENKLKVWEYVLCPQRNFGGNSLRWITRDTNEIYTHNNIFQVRHFD